MLRDRHAIHPSTMAANVRGSAIWSVEQKPRSTGTSVSRQVLIQYHVTCGTMTVFAMPLHFEAFTKGSAYMRLSVADRFAASFPCTLLYNHECGRATKVDEALGTVPRQKMSMHYHICHS
eukprot:574108-Amphidinium_carterae.2